MDRILDTPDNGKVKALIVVPTRELAYRQAAKKFGYTGVSSLVLWRRNRKEFSEKRRRYKTEQIL